MTTCDQTIKEHCARYILEEPNPVYRREIELLLANNGKKNQQELMNRMSHLSFGTAGLRGKMEAGYNRMNLVSVYRFAYALGVVLTTHCPNKPVVVIGYDARENSPEFAFEVARILRAMGATIHLFDKCMPTPLCAYATKNLGAKAGVMITASHNPSYDNGIKLYDEASSQVFGSWLEQIEINIKKAPLRCDFGKEKMVLVDNTTIYASVDEIAKNYFRDIKQTKLFTKSSCRADIGIVYTPLHGVGGQYFLRALDEEGFNNVLIVPSQLEPDGKFPTVLFPNPEENHTLDAAHKLAFDRGYDWVFANDPDADRLQVSCKSAGNFRKLSGNEMGVIFGYFAIKRATEFGIKPLLASSIVSSRMLKAMCSRMNAHYVDGITGFGNIIHAAKKFELSHGTPLVFAYEEAIGFLLGRVVLDKDGINAGARFMEIVALLEGSKKSVWQLLDDLYMQFGLFVNTQWSLRFDGATATEIMEKFMSEVRALSTSLIARFLGQSDCRKFDLASGEKNIEGIDMLADVIIFEIENHSRLIVRPSGTEPKIKFYLELFAEATNHQMLSDKRSELNREIVNLKNSIESNLINRGLIVQ